MVQCVAVALMSLTPCVNRVLCGAGLWVVGVPCVTRIVCGQHVVRAWRVVLIGPGVCTVRRMLMSALPRLSTRSAKHGRLSDMGRLVQSM